MPPRLRSGAGGTLSAHARCTADDLGDEAFIGDVLIGGNGNGQLSPSTSPTFDDKSAEPR